MRFHLMSRLEDASLWGHPSVCVSVKRDQTEVTQRLWRLSTLRQHCAPWNERFASYQPADPLQMKCACVS